MTQQVNLFQPIFRKQEKKFSAQAMLYAAGAVVVGVAALFGYVQWQVNALRTQRRDAEQQYAAASARLTEISTRFGGPVGGITDLNAQIARLERRITAKQALARMLQHGVYGNTRGFSRYLTSFAREIVPGVWITGFDITGAAEQMVLQGRSATPRLVPRYLQRLATEPALAGVEFSTFRIERPAGHAAAPYVEFQARTAAPPPG